MNLNNISFGERVAEQESEKLENYFVQTQQWESLHTGKIDIVFGSKGSGKSALYTVLLKKYSEFESKNIILLSAEKPTGKTVFSEINDASTTSEKEFERLWKIYFLQLISDWLNENDYYKDEAKNVIDKLIEAGLIEQSNTIKKLVGKAISFVRKMVSIDSIEGSMGVADGISGKITFGTPSDTQKRQGFISVDDLYEQLNVFLKKMNLNFWILSDRLDVAFEQNLELEKNALRALFKVYLDLEEYKNISLKIFLRNDIWYRITKDGFREASHIIRTTSIEWTNNNLLNLVVIRSLENSDIMNEFKVNAQDIKSSFEKQKDFYYTLFPKQVEVGEKQSETFDWIISRVKDGLDYVAPRELIHFYNQIILSEQQEQDIGNNKIEDPNIVSRQAIKKSILEVSKVKMEQTIFAEYPHLRSYIMAFENQKAEHSLDTAIELWQVDRSKATEIATELSDIGFIEQKMYKNNLIIKIPFLYRPYLNIIQGKAL
ncbi:hypothetical protein C9446_07325 [Providencia heimbachae]|uniref:P-loop ATPase, Sll1717 family n=1 Tax=Providencia heimbachae TaxID=333962 RepID=UPI0010BF01DC|nr:hypothetical protein [Providencia heimbachae]QCJ69677.1 hypothetical protein C9446_07325 [Providencia heimbachae]